MIDDKFADDHRAQLARKHFPKQWARVEAAEGKTRARYNLKIRATTVERLQNMRAQGKRCGNCDCFQSSRIDDKMCCARDSFGWDGDLIVKASGLCTKWEPRKDVTV